MRYSKIFSIVLCIFVLFCGCQNSGSIIKDNLRSQSDEQPGYENPFTINGREFSIEEINTGIKDTINNQLYLYGRVGGLRNNDIPYDIEYELYFDPSHYGYSEKYPFWEPKTVFLFVTNMPNPIPADETSFYLYGIPVTEWGLRSDFCLISKYTKKIPLYYYDEVELVSLGHYTMRIDDIVKPQYVTMDAVWIENTKNEIRMYMDYNDFYKGEPDENLVSGNYRVYVQNFFKSDDDSTIIFEHENGNIYTGWYNHVHGNSGNYPANLRHVELVENPDEESFKSYLDRVREDPALIMEYIVK